jgi:hypothetical protein
MISDSLVAEIRRLLAAGHTQREVARTVGVARNTVSTIAASQRPDRATVNETELSSLPRTQARRCTTCGGMVYPPCKLCKLRASLV